MFHGSRRMVRRVCRGEKGQIGWQVIEVDRRDGSVEESVVLGYQFARKGLEDERVIQVTRSAEEKPKIADVDHEESIVNEVRVVRVVGINGVDDRQRRQFEVVLLVRRDRVEDRECCLTGKYRRKPRRHLGSRPRSSRLG